MKILFYNHTPQVSGAERVLAMILARLDRHRFEPVVLCPADGAMRDLAEAQGVRCLSVPPLQARFTWRPDAAVRYLASFWRTIRAARGQVVEAAPDLIHANSIRAGLVMAAATVGLAVPVIWHLHDLLPRHPFSTAIRLFALLSDRNRMLAVSQAVAAKFQGRLLRLARRRVPIAVLRNAVASERFAPDMAAARAFRDELRLTPNQTEINSTTHQPYIIAAVGMLTPRKGQLELIRAFAQVVKQLPQAVLVIAGAPLFNRDEEYQQKLIATARELGLSDRVRFLGPRRDVAAIYQAADVLVVNSWAEPFALVVLEGLASGAALVATAVGGTPEMIEHGEQGWLVPPGDQAALAAAIVKLLTEPELRTRLAAAGRARAQRQFSLEQYLRELEEFYARAVSPPPRAGVFARTQHS